MLTAPNWSIRKTLNLLLLCSLFPAMGAILFYGWLETKTDSEELAHQLTFMSKSLAEQKTQQAAAIKVFLRTLSELSIVKHQNVAAVDKLFAQIVVDNSIYGNVALVKPDGTVSCSGVAFKPQTTMAGLKVFQDAVQTRAFSAGEFAVSPIIGVASFHFAMPVFDEGVLTGILALALPLDNRDGLTEQIVQVEGARVAFLDHALLRIHRIPEDPALPRGTAAAAGVLDKLVADTNDSGVFEAVGGDGAYLLYGFNRLRLAPGAPPYLTVLVGAPKPDLLRALSGRLGQSLLVVAGVLIVALGVSRLLSEKSLGYGVDQLTKAVHSLSKGDFAARVGDIRACSELVQFGRAFDQMMNELADREHALRSGKEQLAAILDSTSDGMYGVDSRGKITFVNPAALNMLRYPEASLLLGRDVHSLLHHSRHGGGRYPISECPVYQALKNGQAASRDDEVFWTADGREFYVEYSVNPIVTVQGISGAVVAFRDITERTKVYNELARHRENLEVLVLERTAKLQEANRALKVLNQAVEQSPVSVLITSRNGLIEYVNPRFTETTGYTLGDCQGNSPRILKSGEQSQEFYQDLWATICAGNTWKGDFINVKKTGERFWESASIAPILDENGEITHFMAVKLDITLKKLAEEALRDKQKYLATILQAVNTGILLVDLATHIIVDVNPAAEGIIGAGKVELLGKDCRTVLCTNADLLCANLLEDAGVTSRETVLTNLQGKRVPVLRSSVAVVIGGQTCILESLLDITERKRLEEELRTLAFTDPLTGVNNRRRFLDLAKHELERSKRYGTSFTYLILDVDHFKAINDAYGHDQGDRVLKRLAATCQNMLRDTDFFGRLGGEEFGAVLIESSDEEAMAVATRLRLAVQDDPFDIHGKEVRLTVSIGICSWRAGDESLKEIMRRADMALYAAKDQGRNRVMVG